MSKNIVLIGLTGCGKSTLGRGLSRRLCMPFIDMDDYIEKKEGKAIRNIFAEHGEAYFRTLETRAAQELSEKKGYIIATGGGAVLNPKNMEYLKKTGVVLFIDRSPEAILKKLDLRNRPLLAANKNHLYTLDKERRPLYEGYADITLHGSRSVWRAVHLAARLLSPHLKKPVNKRKQIF
ncbi:MAG: shikimate kinase [Ruminococcaceae bacterium]|nr:shikimate kinase [Oscillospiraceae bacterium]